MPFAVGWEPSTLRDIVWRAMGKCVEGAEGVN